MSRATRTRAGWAAAAQDLARRHDLAAELHERHGAPTELRVTPPSRRFASLAQAIAYQQLNGTAAATIWSRVVTVVGDPDDPVAVAATSHDDLRAAGLSGAKALAIADLAGRTMDGRLRLVDTGRMADDQVVEHLCQVRGIGPWTAHMFLMFDLGRCDVWPTGDYGVRAGWARLTGADSVPAERGFAEVGEPFVPYRSVMAWWCWREVDTTVLR